MSTVTNLDAYNAGVAFNAWLEGTPVTIDEGLRNFALIVGWSVIDLRKTRDMAGEVEL